MTKYLLLTPLIPKYFSIDTFEEIKEALAEFGCQYIISKDPMGDNILFATAKSLKIIVNMVEIVNLPGVVVECTSVYDQFVEA